MSEAYNLTTNQSFLLFDSDTMPRNINSPLAHFALTDALISYAGQHNQAIIHFWQTDPLVILGMMDTQLGHFTKALDVFTETSHDYIIRNSGGLAIVSDPGILNMSLIYPLDSDNPLTIKDAYERMLAFIRTSLYSYFPQHTIEAFEVKHSYCFGDYDLSINQQKIAGTSQRRIKNGLAIMVYISVNGQQKERAKVLKEFYEQAVDGSEPAGRYPEIKSEVMTTLEDAYQIKLTVKKVKKMMREQLDWSVGKYHSEIMNEFNKALAKMYQRNIKFLGESYVQNNLIRSGY